MNRSDDLEKLAEVRPFIRSAVALLIFTFYRPGYTKVMDVEHIAPMTVDSAYAHADLFLAQLELDLR